MPDKPRVSKKELDRFCKYAIPSTSEAYRFGFDLQDARKRIAELEAAIATAKRIGAVEELERIAEDYIHEYLSGAEYCDIAERPWTCTQDLKRDASCIKCELLNRASELRKELECPATT